MKKPALLALEDGSLFWGTSIGADGSALGELVFNTEMLGYQEVLTDPGYAGKIVSFTYPHIGNTGINQEDFESAKMQAEALVIKSLPNLYSNFRADQSLQDFLQAQNKVAISDIDTRQLMLHLRDKGTLKAAVFAGENINADEAIAAAKNYAGISGQDLASKVCTSVPCTWAEGGWQLNQGFRQLENPKYKVVVLDLGVKRSFLRQLVDLGCELTIVPAKTSADEILALNPTGVFVSNGPGDANACDYAVATVKTLLDKNIPMMAVGLGHQVLALAAGGQVVKLKTGSYGANHPVQDLASNAVMITSAHYDFTVSEPGLVADLEVTHKSLFDNSIMGIKHKTKPAFGFQGHPNTSPQPRSIKPLFAQFEQLLAGAK